jgi:hypothetical protein
MDKMQELEENIKDMIRTANPNMSDESIDLVFEYLYGWQQQVDWDRTII